MSKENTAGRLRVAVLYGGRSAEHEISQISARFVARNLDPQRFEVVPIGITEEGRWVLPASGLQALEAEHIDGAPLAPDFDGRLLRAAAPGAGGAPAAVAAATGPVDVVFPVLHGPFGEDGTVQGFLELAGIPYVGAGVLGSAIGMDKIAQKTILAAHGIPVPRFRAVRRHDWQRRRDAELAAIERELGYPVFVKPSNLGSSVGISGARDRAELVAGLDLAAQFDLRLLVETAIEEAREIECAVIGNDEPEVSVPGEVRPTREFYDYEAKYIDAHGADLIIPAELPPPVAGRVRELAAAAYRALDCAGMARVDFFVRPAEGDIWLNEINTIPGFTRISMFPRLWEASGLPAPRLVERLVEYALERHRQRRALRTRR